MSDLSKFRECGIASVARAHAYALIRIFTRYLRAERGPDGRRLGNVVRNQSGPCGYAPVTVGCGLPASNDTLWKLVAFGGLVPLWSLVAASHPVSW
jgi:hypothetical protein